MSTEACRIAWAVVVLTALTAFSYAVSTKVQEYLEHNSQIEVKSDYKTELPFPRVTICNLNPYKIAWAVVVLTALTAFSYAVSTKVQEYLEHNSQIEVKSDYKTELPFPRVTICNLNPYK
ncbi:hypothetical protein CAPTEDRAFT_194983 [Capitella teleta]|uniref:Uncharacterized protein n=1 Tax=Capitella teleta TaxID=283909 RepID=R7VGW0_CAPTE|nr:hypothetical protein CAPTEDRAFT_194983 [Capitella teleta]|eukprot:ELU17844.1 hypothetical protein CAPTEDRAFT_194983 [Capitella teleta]